MTTLLTASQVAERLGVTARSVRRYTADGDIPAHFFRGRNYYDWEEVCEAVKRWAQPNTYYDRYPVRRTAARPRQQAAHQAGGATSARRPAPNRVPNSLFKYNQ